MEMIDIDAKKGTINVRSFKKQLASKRKNGKSKKLILEMEHCGNMHKQ